MLQIRNLTKRYSTKGETVEALHHVSLDFPETGMVFLLGKSGSGKSTLLNLAGGLDSPDEGEIIVKGKSSKDFSESDFDSYRNTYVGFIFQEYNILNELTVGENVALALELQGKPKDSAHISELLEMVDLQGYADRKPNTLSGGQKQRVAIARALVKEPEIIMADEPTGALDSQTGAQVFDTLKKLSREKLVVIVSHDRDFAETYADRIIELRDGSIISDVTRSGDGGERKNVIEAGPKKLTVVNGAALTQEDEARILQFLRSNKGSVVLSAEKEELPAAAKAAGTFAPTDTTPAPREENTASFIPSRFPARYAFKMGAASLRFKPLRLVVTVLLAAIAFIVFGVFSTMITYSPADMGISGLVGSSYGAAMLEKQLIMHGTDANGNEYTRRLQLSGAPNFVQEEVETIREDSGLNFLPVFTFGETYLSFLPSFAPSDSELYRESEFYYALRDFSGFAEASYILEDPAFTLAAGSFPTAKNEGMISTHVADAFLSFGYRSDNGEIEAISSYEDLIGKQLHLSVGLKDNAFYVTVTGIFDAGEDLSAFDALKSNDLLVSEQEQLAEELSEVFLNSMSSVCFVGEGFYEEYAYFDVAERNCRTLLSQVERDYGGTTAYTEESASARRYQRLMAPLSSDREGCAAALFAYYGREERELDLSYNIPYAFLDSVDQGQEIYTLIFPIIGAAAGVLALFAALLLFSFISQSINGKKKEIGILRAVGARGIDVFKIFIVEGIAVTLICLALGILGSIAACALTNSILISEGVLAYDFFLFTWKNALILFGIAAVTSLVATGIPVAVFSKKKPVETIRSI